MRRPAKAALVLTFATCAALALLPGIANAAPKSGGTVVTFTRSAVKVASATERTWYVVTGRTTFGEDDGLDVEIPELPTSLPGDAYGRLQLLHDAGLALDASTLEEALEALELPFMFAGRAQWVMNLSTPDGAAADPRLWNVSMENPLHDVNSLRILLGRAAWAAETRGTMADDVAYWQSLVPDWAPDVRDALAAEGIPFSVELLASPEIEIADLAKPLFPKGSHPDSLFGLGVLQSGENSFLRSMGADEVMSDVWPLYYRYHHRPAGAPVPDDLKAGLTFGTVISESCSEQTADGCINGLRYKHTPVMSTDSYMRWLAYGFPGISGEGQRNGWIVDDITGYGYNPTTGELKPFHDPSLGSYGSYRRMWIDLILSGQVQASHFITPWNKVVQGGVGSRLVAAGILRDPSIWFSGQYEPYGPDKISAATKARYLTLVGEK